MSFDLRDLSAGLAVALTGAFAIVQSAAFPLGTLARMGPGYFPLLLGALLLALGLGIVVFDARTAGADRGADVISRQRLRAICTLAAAPMAFAVLIEPAGLVPAVFAAVFVSTFADRGAGLLRASLLAAGVTVFSVLIFKVGLNLPIDLIG